jgi:beta-fructofuranosidase
MWDTWIYEEDGAYHLFFLQSDPGKTWNTIGRAVSRDLLHWTTLPAIETQGPAGAWDHGPTLTGITVKHAGRYHMFYAGEVAKQQQIGLMVSDDLKNWTKYPKNPTLTARPPLYGGNDWRDLFAWHDPHSGLWNAAVCARTADGQSAIAHLVSRDLLDWQYLKPLYVDAGFSDMEVPEYFTMGGRHYLLLSNIRAPHDISGRKQGVGTYFVIADNADGPYRLMPGSLLLGSGNGRFDVYVGRTLRHGNNRLLYSQTVGGRVTWSTPKIIRQKPDGELYLEWWPELARLETRTVLEAKRVKPGPQAVTLDEGVLTLEVEVRKGGAALIGWRQGVTLALDASASKVRIEQQGSKPDEIHLPGLDSAPHQLRLWCRGGRAEVYLDGRWLFNYRLKDPAPPRPLELSPGSRYRNLRLAELEPLAR